MPVFRPFVVKLAPVLASVAVAAPATGAPPGHPPALEAPAVSDGALPISQRFPNLDAYLAHLKRRSAIDGPWYREIRPGVFELQTGNFRPTDGASRQRIFTRAELEKNFGFAK